MEMTHRIILMGGTSHVGKSSVARAFAARLGWTTRSTDLLARHPGRPWGNIPPHVAEHYRSLDVDAQIESVMAHYERLSPAIAEIVETEDQLVLEGSALLPHNIATLRGPSLILTASDRLIEKRMYRESNYADADPEARALIDNFLARTRRFNEIILVEAKALGVEVMEVKDGMSAEDVAAAIAAQ